MTHILSHIMCNVSFIFCKFFKLYIVFLACYSITKKNGMVLVAHLYISYFFISLGKMKLSILHILSKGFTTALLKL